VKIDKASLIGLILGILAIVGGNYLEGGYIASLLQPTAALIVLGGTIGATVLNYPLETLKASILALRKAFWGDRPDLKLVVNTIVIFAQKARKEGIVSLESFAESMSDPFLRKAVLLAVDGVDQEMLQNSMELELEQTIQRGESSARVFESAGGYAPTLGILGAVLGLIHVMNNLTDPTKLGAGIAVAFVATVYGVGSANLVFLPIAGKLKNKLHEETLAMEIVLEGVLSIQRGENPRLVEQKLLGFLEPENRRSYKSVIPSLPRSRVAA
jgi:chemotaxis protein MotA